MKKILLCIAIFHVGLVQANNFSDRVQVKVRAGYSIGATAPIGIPATIRSIESYRLTPNLMLGADVVLPFSEKWGVTTGLHFENKGLDGEITTKGYRMKVRMDESELEGYFTGHVRQKVRQWMLTLPIEATLQLSNKLQLRGGPYVSVLTNRDFSGYAFSGYLRVDDPTGARVDMGKMIFDPARIPVAGDSNRIKLSCLSHTMEFFCLNAGNPHAVTADYFPSDGEFEKMGSALEFDPAFPERANVSFIKVLSPKKIKARVWERGSGPTMACGSGATACLVAAFGMGLCDDRATVCLPGGELFIEYDSQSGHAFMTGPAETVFVGDYLL